MVPRNRWGIHQILAILVQHHEDKRLKTPYRQFRRFAYQTMMTETRKEGCWPKALYRRDWRLMLQLRLQSEAEILYGKEVQQLCKTKGFGFVDKSSFGDVDRAPLEGLVDIAKTTAPMLTSLVNSIGPLTTSSNSAHLVSMKLIAILVIFCRSAHRNNSSYFSLLIALYLYSSGACIDAITLLNHLGLSVSYDTVQHKLKNISSASARWIQKQAFNSKLVGK